MIRHLNSLTAVFKVRISIAIVLCALAGMAIMPGPALPFGQTLFLALAVLLSSSAAGAFNHYAERDLDAKMPRTRNRPFVTGEFDANRAWLLVIVLVLAGAVGIAAWALNFYVALHTFLGAIVYGFVYTVWLKRRTSWNIVVGGLAGSFAVLAGAASINPMPSPTALLLALTLFLWTPPHFWSLATVMQKQYADAGIPMLPVVVGAQKSAWIILGHTIVLVGVSLLPAFYGMGPIYLAGACAGGGYFLWFSIRLVRNPTPTEAMANFKASFVQLGTLLTATLVDGSLTA